MSADSLDRGRPIRVMAIDHGERRLGIALSDPSGVIALPFEVLERSGWSRDLAHIRGLIETYGVGEVIVGRPLTTRGEVGGQTRHAARFAARLRASIGIPVREVDERFSTAAAERSMREAGVSQRQGRTKRDAAAAALILQPYLDRRRTQTPLPGLE